MTENLTWRGATAEDAPLLFTLFCATKAEEFAPLGLSGQQLQPLLEMQYRACKQHYEQTHPTAVNMILCLADGTPVGRHLVERQAKAYRGIDLAILPEYQNRGIGTWALRQAQQIAALEEVPFRLSVFRTNPAFHLYERLGFLKVSANEIAYEMEHLSRSPLTASPNGKPDLTIATAPGETFSRTEALERIFAFLREIGLTVQIGPVPQQAFPPGIQLISNGLRVDTESLLHPGDLLHEAGRLAVISPSDRLAEFPTTTKPGEEMAAMAWSYAALRHIGLPPEVVFHQHGYKGQSASLIASYGGPNPLGLPMLWYLGLTTQQFPDSPTIFPRMLRWLREAPIEQPEESLHQELCNTM